MRVGASSISGPFVKEAADEAVFHGGGFLVLMAIDEDAVGGAMGAGHDFLDVGRLRAVGQGAIGRGVNINDDGNGWAEESLYLFYLGFDLGGVVQICLRGFGEEGKEHTVEEIAILSDEGGVDFGKVTAGNEGEFGILLMREVENGFEFGGGVEIEIGGEVVDAPGDEVGMLVAEFGDFNGPTFVIEAEGFGIKSAEKRRGFGGRDKGDPDLDVMFAGCGKEGF
ncbi:MAG: hypothetical protein JWQ71_1576 [Pedosphaera sp.]|nr:hypothetical protein [Pedosphaera sp.]